MGIVSIVPVVGGIVGAAYLLWRDGLEFDLMYRRSIGKKRRKLRPVRLDSQPMYVDTSVKRNLPLRIGAMGAISGIIPTPGWIIGILLALSWMVVAIVELLFVLTEGQGGAWATSAPPPG